MRVLKIIWLLCLYLFISCAGSIAALDKPFGPVIYTDNLGGIQLYWFYPGLHDSTIGNTDRIPELQLCPSAGPDRYSVFGQVAVDPPVEITEISTFIWNFDLFPELPGDQYTPVQLTLGSNLTGDGTGIIYGGSVSLPNPAPSGGSRVCRAPQICHTSDYYIFAGLKWDPAYRCAPLIGGLNTQSLFPLWISDINDNQETIYECQDNYMLGLKILGYRSDDTTLPDGLSFDIIYSNDSLFNQDAIPVSANLSRAELKYLITDPNPGWYKIRAARYSDTAYSDSIYYSPRYRLPIELDPPVFNVFGEYNVKESYNLLIINKGSSDLNLRLSVDTSILSISADSLSLEAGQTESIRITPFLESWQDSLIISRLLITSPDSSYAMSYALVFNYENPTDTDYDRQIVPAEFYVSSGNPNPFNGSVSFEINSGGDDDIRLEIYNLLGRKVASQNLGSRWPATCTWDMQAQRFSSGLYFFKFIRKNQNIIRRLVYLK